MTIAVDTPESERPLTRLLVESTLDVTGPLSFDLSEMRREDALAAADDHRVAPAVFRRLRSAGAPTEWEQAFAVERHGQLIRHMRTHAELAEISSALGTAGIGWLVAKGPVAADAIWPHPDMREYHDVDLFVEAADFEQALEVLLASGCTLVDRNWPELAQTMRAEVALIGKFGTPIDLHWHIAIPGDLRRAFHIDMAEMFVRARTITLGNGHDVRTFDEVDTVLHLAFHAAQAGASKLMWAGDIHYALDAPAFDVEEFLTRARRARIIRPVSVVLNRVRSVLGDGGRPALYSSLDSGGAWGRVIGIMDRRATFPALPRDDHAGGIPISGVRPTTIGSAVATTRAALQVRSIERRIKRAGPEDRTLHHDVPDESARRAYFEETRTTAGATA